MSKHGSCLFDCIALSSVFEAPQAQEMILLLGMGVTVVIRDCLWTLPISAEPMKICIIELERATNQGDSDPNLNAILVGPGPRVGG